MYLKEGAKCCGNNLFLTFKCLLIIYLQIKFATLEFHQCEGWGGAAGICQAGWNMVCLIQKLKYFKKYSIRLEDLEALTGKG